MSSLIGNGAFTKFQKEFLLEEISRKREMLKKSEAEKEEAVRELEALKRVDYEKTTEKIMNELKVKEAELQKVYSKEELQKERKRSEEEDINKAFLQDESSNLHFLNKDMEEKLKIMDEVCLDLLCKLEGVKILKDLAEDDSEIYYPL